MKQIKLTFDYMIDDELFEALSKETHQSWSEFSVRLATEVMTDFAKDLSYSVKTKDLDLIETNTNIIYCDIIIIVNNNCLFKERKFIMVQITIETKPDFTFHKCERDGIEVISNRTGYHYSLVHGSVTDKFNKNYTTDIMYIMKMIYDEDVDGYIYDTADVVGWTFGAEFIYRLDSDYLQDICDMIRDYEYNLFN